MLQSALLCPSPQRDLTLGPKRVAKSVLGAPRFEKQKIAENFSLESSSRDCCRRFRMSAAAGPKRFQLDRLAITAFQIAHFDRDRNRASDFAAWRS